MTSAAAEPRSDAVVVPDFDAVYATDTDPWQVLEGPYETRKLAILLASLSRPRYRLGWDPACGVGALTAQLAGRCERVHATDGSARAVDLTRGLCRDLTNVAHDVVSLPARPSLPAGAVDLVVISEFLYYLPTPDRIAALGVVDDLAADEAEVASVHWRPHPHDAYLSGAAMEAEIADHLSSLGWRQVVDHQEPEFVLSTFVRHRRR